MIWLARCDAPPDLPDVHLQYRGYKRQADGDPPVELVSPNVKWIKRAQSSGGIVWSMVVKYQTVDGVRESHATPAQCEDRAT